MPRIKKRYEVWYETVDLVKKVLIPHVLVKDVDWKTALMIKRNHKKICAMHIRPVTAAQRS